MGLWAWLTGAEAVKQLPKAVDAIISTGDALVYTDEEKAGDEINRMKLALEWTQKTLMANGVQSVVRRLLAIAFCGELLLAFNIALFCAIQGKMEVVTRIINVVEAFKIGWATITILTFYFGVHTLRWLTEKQ